MPKHIQIFNTLYRIDDVLKIHPVNKEQHIPTKVGYIVPVEFLVYDKTPTMPFSSTRKYTFETKEEANTFYENLVKKLT